MYLLQPWLRAVTNKRCANRHTGGVHLASYERGKRSLPSDGPLLETLAGLPVRREWWWAWWPPRGVLGMQVLWGLVCGCGHPLLRADLLHGLPPHRHLNTSTLGFLIPRFSSLGNKMSKWESRGGYKLHTPHSAKHSSLNTEQASFSAPPALRPGVPLQELHFVLGWDRDLSFYIRRRISLVCSPKSSLKEQQWHQIHQKQQGRQVETKRHLTCSQAPSVLPLLWRRQISAITLLQPPPKG